MRVYLVTFTPGRRAPDPRQIDAQFMDVAMDPLGSPWRAEEWTSGDQAARLTAWSNEPVDARLLPSMCTNGEAALGCPGYLGDLGDADRLLAASDLGAAADGLQGVFGVFRAEQRGFQAITTATRLHPVYYARVGDACVAGNRAVLVYGASRALEGGQERRPTRYDLRALQALVRSGYLLNDDTPFEGVKALTAHSTLDVRDGAARVTQRPLPRFEPDATPRQRQSLMSDFVDCLASATSPLRAFSMPLWLSLTGGRDSRVAAAMLSAAQLNFRASTAGFPDHPDVVLAGRISKLLGVQHTISTPSRDELNASVVVSHPLVRTWEVVRWTDGMYSAYHNLREPSAFKVSPKISGAGGEQLRGGFLFKEAALAPETLQAHVRDLFLGSERHFTDAANEVASGELAPWARRAADDPLAALDLLYLYYRTGRWSAAGRAVSMTSFTTFNLLLDNRLIRQALVMPAKWRWSERPLTEAIGRLAPALRRVPLAGRRWRHQTSGPMGALRRWWPGGSPLRAAPRGAGFDWRDLSDDTLLTSFREQILGGPQGLFEIVKRPAIEALLAKPPAKRATAALLWNTLTASVLLSDQWLSPKPSRADMLIQLPPSLLPAPDQAADQRCGSP